MLLLFQTLFRYVNNAFPLEIPENIILTYLHSYHTEIGISINRCRCHLAYHRAHVRKVAFEENVDFMGDIRPNTVLICNGSYEGVQSNKQSNLLTKSSELRCKSAFLSVCHYWRMS